MLNLKQRQPHFFFDDSLLLSISESQYALRMIPSRWQAGYQRLSQWKGQKCLELPNEKLQKVSKN
jgi:hypothetical protein